MLYNNQNKYTSELLVPNTGTLVNWARDNHIDLTEPEGLESALKQLASVINQFKNGGAYEDLFPSRWLPAAIAILDEPFNLDNQLLNSTGKMVRAKIVEYHKDKIHYLYTPQAKDIVNPMNLEALKKALNRS